MVEFMSANSGVALYFSNWTSHSAVDVGYFMPATRFHSVIESPDSVNRVSPPIMTIPKTSPEAKRYQYPTAFFDMGASVTVSVRSITGISWSIENVAVERGRNEDNKFAIFDFGNAPSMEVFVNADLKEKHRDDMN